jgi:hypothetical protein
VPGGAKGEGIQGGVMHGHCTDTSVPRMINPVWVATGGGSAWAGAPSGGPGRRSRSLERVEGALPSRPGRITGGDEIPPGSPGFP